MNAAEPLLPPRPEITAALARELAARLRAHGATPEQLAVMRLEHPGLRLASCSADDVPARMPAWLEDGGDLEIYLLDASEHCVSLTTDPGRACGLLFAWVSED